MSERDSQGPSSLGSHASGDVSDGFLRALALELAGPDTRAIILVGSIVHGDATAYSDIDLAHIVSAVFIEPDLRYFYRAGRLVGVATRQLGWYREVLTRPDRALFALASLRTARILVDRDGAFGALQREAQQFAWTSLQAAADEHASTLLMELAEAAHKVLSARIRQNNLALYDATSSLVFGLTQAVAVQRGVLVVQGSGYMQQVREVAGEESAWVRYHRLAIEPDVAGAGEDSAWARAAAALRLYQETIALLGAAMQPDHRLVADTTARMIAAVLDHPRGDTGQLLSGK